MNAIELDSVCKSFGAVRAVDELSVRVPQGSVYGFLGPNGAGKTTTLRMIMDIIRPDSGTIRLFNDGLSRDVHGRVGYMPEERGLYRKMTTSGVLAYFGSLKGMAGAALNEAVALWLQRVGLAAHANQKVEELSRGMHQKLQFAVTVINDPELVILDEPFSGLDPVNQDLLREIITGIRQAGKTVLFSTHVMHEAERLCDFIVLINRGRIVVDGRLPRSARATSRTPSAWNSRATPAFWRRCPGWRRSGLTARGWTSNWPTRPIRRTCSVRWSRGPACGRLRSSNPRCMRSSCGWSERAMHRILRVAQREYLETVRSKTFVLGLLMVPIIIVAVILLGERVGRGSRTAPRETILVTVTASSAELLAKVEATFEEHNEAHPDREIVAQTIHAEADDKTAQDQGKQKLRDGRVHAFVVVAEDGAGDSETVRLYTHQPKPAHLDALWTVESLVREAVVDRRCEVQGLDRALLDKIRAVPIERVELGGDSGDERVQDKGQQVARMMLPFAFMYLIFMGIVGTGQQMLTSIIEEKNSRIVEVLLSAISPFELMAGKIAGLAGIGLTVTALWALAAYGGARWQGIQIAVSPDLLVYVLIYYVLGFVLFSAILAAIGSVCNTLKEAQSLMMPVMLVLIIPLMSWFQLAQNPNGSLARGLSYVPPATPMVMVLRLSTGAGVWIGEVVGTIALLAVSVLGTMWIAAKIFRTGILMYGKRPTPREVLRWLAQN
jgi:ABC-type uncharacterized transport system ATPase subunit/ABC-type Na+ efflux pump permease subunit